MAALYAAVGVRDKVLRLSVITITHLHACQVRRDLEVITRPDLLDARCRLVKVHDYHLALRVSEGFIAAHYKMQLCGRCHRCILGRAHEPYVLAEGS